MTEKWCEIQGKLDLAQVSGVFKLSKLELLKFYCIWKKQKKKNDGVMCVFVYSILHTTALGNI